jgi:phosphate uptake regulator
LNDGKKHRAALPQALLQQQPVARDLRQISTALKMITV